MSEYLEHPDLPPAAHDGDDVSPRFMLLFLGGIGTVLLLLLGLVWWLFPGTPHEQALSGRLPAFPQPQLQTDDRNDMTAFLHAEMQYLNGTGWVDQARGQVHIPIDQAMQDVARDGIPDWPTTPLPPAPTPAAPAVPEGAR
jgi:hypothetical protein